MRSMALLLLVVAGCSAPERRPVARAATHKPRLVVLLVIDQLPEWAFEQKLPAMTGGFARLVREGQWHIGRHPSMATITAPGHTLLGSGKTPSESGVLANEWWERDSERVVLACDSDGNSPWDRVPGLADSVDAVGVSLKVRAARLPLGKGGLAIWYDAKTGSWRSIGREAPWVAALPKPQLSTWTPLSTDIDDARPGEVGEKGFGPTFPHDPMTTKNPYDAVFAMPLGNEIVLDTALAAVEHEHPRLLVVSLSANDYIGHGWGHESLEAWDATRRLDGQLAGFMTALERDHELAMVVTSDHGAAPMPNQRLQHEKIKAAANEAARAVLGPGEWVVYAHFPGVYLAKAALASPDIDKAINKIVLALRAFPGIGRVERKADIAGNCDARKDDERAMCLALDPVRSGDIIFTTAAGWITEDEDEPLATAHGSLQDYDRNVPLLVLPFDHTPHAPDRKPRDVIGLERVHDMVLELVNKRPRTPLSWTDL